MRRRSAAICRAAGVAGVPATTTSTLVVVGDHREAVLRIEAVEPPRGRPAWRGRACCSRPSSRTGRGRSARFTARPAAGRVRGDRGRDDIHEQEPLAAAVGPDEPAVGADHEAGIGEAEPDRGPVSGAWTWKGLLLETASRPGWGGSHDGRVGRSTGARIRRVGRGREPRAFGYGSSPNSSRAIRVSWSTRLLAARSRGRRTCSSTSALRARRSHVLRSPATDRDDQSRRHRRRPPGP